MNRPEDDGYWFAPKRYGYGAGRPIAWQGWALLGLYVAILVVASLLIGQSARASAVIVATATAVLFLIVSRTTRGGLGWGWDEKE